MSDLSSRVGATAPRRERSRLMIRTAVMVFALGAIASFGGLGYAASGAEAVKNAVTKDVAVTSAAKTSAGDQYGEQSVPTSEVKSATATSPQQTASATTPKSDTLPFTGLGLGATALVGSALLGLGVFLRRRESRE